MLERLHIKNIAVIDEAEIEFNKGFNVLTGETGAGKSIIIDSINMVLGERTSKSIIRNGEKKAVVEAMFSIDNPEIIKTLDENGIEVEDGMLILYRDLNTDGKSLCKINGSMTTASGIREIANMLINIHGQQDNQALLTPSSHISFLNSYANLASKLDEYRVYYNKVNEISDKLNSLQVDEREKERMTDLYTFQIKEIEDAKLVIGEDEQLTERRKLISGINKISETLNYSHEVLYSSDRNVYDTISSVVSSFVSVTEYDVKLNEIYERLNSAAIELDDIIYQIRDYRDGMNFDKSEADSIEARLDLINTLKRKYGNSIEEIIEYKNDIEDKLYSITKSDEETEKLNKELAATTETRNKIAAEITKTRTKYAIELSDKICKELADLDMAKVKFDVQIKECDYNKNGCDSVEFLISVNAGEPLKPLSKIASGGEMSRIMLAIKSIFADSDPVDTLIFDEIDTGVSGRAAQKIAEKINKIAGNKQILCITHLAQIAAMAGTHFLIEKNVDAEHTYTNVTPLDENSRKNELARIIGGAQITDITIQAASEMLELADKLKRS
ncbi:MAG: DNA repair protein RecN [Clostridia bacterium]|nr:DNA repair protein RecN [Clostridia bacterium]